MQGIFFHLLVDIVSQVYILVLLVDGYLHSLLSLRMSLQRIEQANHGIGNRAGFLYWSRLGYKAIARLQDALLCSEVSINLFYGLFSFLLQLIVDPTASGALRLLLGNNRLTDTGLGDCHRFYMIATSFGWTPD